MLFRSKRSVNKLDDANNNNNNNNILPLLDIGLSLLATTLLLTFLEPYSVQVTLLAVLAFVSASASRGGSLYQGEAGGLFVLVLAHVYLHVNPGVWHM